MDGNDWYNVPVYLNEYGGDPIGSARVKGDRCLYLVINEKSIINDPIEGVKLVSTFDFVAGFEKDDREEKLPKKLRNGW